MPWTGKGTGGLAATTWADPAPDPVVEAEEEPRQPLVVVLGPTASGKTILSIPLARALEGEIVCADSRQIYRYMDVGTAKPTAAEREDAPHHLLDIVTPDIAYTLAEYQRAAYAVIAAIHGRGRLPLLVGGTGQYITAVIEGWGIPEVAPNVERRAELEAYAETQGAQALHDRLRAVDPAAAERIDFRNVRRVVRALEVYEETGTPISALQRKQPLPYRVLQLGLTMPREQLFERVDQRIDRMIAAGLEGEVRGLLERGYTWENPAMSGLGYAQWQPFLAGEASLDETVTAIQRATRAYVRRQYTWFLGHDSGIRWLETSHVTPESVIELVRDWLSATGR